MSFQDLALYWMEKGFRIRFVQDLEDYGHGPRAFWVCERSEAVGSAWSAVQRIANAIPRKRQGVRETLRSFEKAVREPRKKLFGR